MNEGRGPRAPSPRGAPRLLGDVIVSVPTARAQAKQGRREALDEVTLLLGHGLLHLLGWDHDTPAKDRAMRARVDRLCAAARRRPKQAARAQRTDAAGRKLS